MARSDHLRCSTTVDDGRRWYEDSWRMSNRRRQSDILLVNPLLVDPEAVQNNEQRSLRFAIEQ